MFCRVFSAAGLRGTALGLAGWSQPKEHALIMPAYRQAAGAGEFGCVECCRVAASIDLRDDPRIEEGKFEDSRDVGWRHTFVFGQFGDGDLFDLQPLPQAMPARDGLDKRRNCGTCDWGRAIMLYEFHGNSAPG